MKLTYLIELCVALLLHPVGNSVGTRDFSCPMFQASLVDTVGMLLNVGKLGNINSDKMSQYGCNNGIQTTIK